MAKVEQAYEARAKAINALGAVISAEVRYIVFQAADEEEALKAVLLEAPKAQGGASLATVAIESRENDDTFKVRAVYEKAQASGVSGNDEEKTTANFDCSGGSVRVIHAISQRCVYGEVNAGCAVGWNGKSGADSEIKGVEVPTANMRKTYRKLMRASKLTTSYENKISNCVGKVNGGKFKGRAKGEVMFLGASYTAPEKGNDKVWVSFNFAIRPNEANAMVNGIPCGKKEGWEVISSIDRSIVDRNGVPGLEISAIHISQVAEYADFSVLGL